MHKNVLLLLLVVIEGLVVVLVVLAEMMGMIRGLIVDVLEHDCSESKGVRCIGLG